MPGRVTTSPRASSCTSSPARLTAVRCPASTRSTGAPWTCRPRTRARRPDGQDLDLLPDGEGARHEGPRHHRAESAQGEGAVHGQAQQALAPAAAAISRARVRSASFSASRPSPVRDETRRMGAPSRNEPATSSRASSSARACRSASASVALGEGDQPARDAQQAADVEVLAGLGHDRLVGGHHQQHGVDPVRARQHVADEPLVAGNVDERSHEAVAQIEVGEAQVDRDAALLLLLQPVRIDAGERPHQRALAVVDVPGGADDQRPHARRFRWPPALRRKRTA